MIELLLQAERALSVGLLDRAETLYRQVARVDPQNSIAVVGLARVTLDRGDDEGALELARQALAIDPENVAAQRMVARLEEIIDYRVSRDDEEAEGAAVAAAGAPTDAADPEADGEVTDEGDADQVITEPVAAPAVSAEPESEPEPEAVPEASAGITPFGITPLPTVADDPQAPDEIAAAAEVAAEPAPGPTSQATAEPAPAMAAETEPKTSAEPEPAKPAVEPAPRVAAAATPASQPAPEVAVDAKPAEVSVATEPDALPEPERRRSLLDWLFRWR